MSDAERSIPATPRRREAARQQGAAPNASLPAFVATAATAVALLPGWSQTAVPAAAASMRAAIASAFAGDAEVAAPLPAAVVLPTMGLVLAAAGAGLGVRFLLDGSAWKLSRAAPRWQRVDPLAGCGRIFSAATARAVVWNGACLVLFVITAAWAATPIVGLVRASGPILEPQQPLAALRGTLGLLILAAAAVAAAQWGLARVAFERRLRMTPEEFQDEMRGLEADPRIRSERQRRAVRRQPVSGTA